MQTLARFPVANVLARHRAYYCDRQPLNLVKAPATDYDNYCGLELNGTLLHRTKAGVDFYRRRLVFGLSD